MPEINITYDLLFDILRIEKSREELQKLEENFYKNVVDYINTKESFINDINTSPGEKELTKIQLGNIKKLIVELYDRREKKIISLAIYKIKTSSGIINTDSLLEEERFLFDILYSDFFKCRSAILSNVITGKIPKTDMLTSQDISNTKMTDDEKSKTRTVYSENDVKSIRFIRPVPRFLGTELEIYGPFEENDIASMPVRIADVLIQKNRAEEMDMK